MMIRTLVALGAALVLAAPAPAVDTVNRLLGGGAASGSVASNAYLWPSSVACTGDILAYGSRDMNIVQRVLPDNTIQDEAGTTLIHQRNAPWTGVALQTSFSPLAIELDFGGRYYIAATRGGGNVIYRAWGPDIEVFTQPSTGGVSLVAPNAITATQTHMLVADMGANRVLFYPIACGGPDCQPDRIVTVQRPMDVAASPDGATIYVLTGQGAEIRRVLPDNTLAPPIVSLFIAQAKMTMAPNGLLYVASATGSRALRVNPADGSVATVAGTGLAQDGGAFVIQPPGASALTQPMTQINDVAVCQNGTLMALPSAVDRRVYLVNLDSGTIATPTATRTVPPATATATRTVAPPTATNTPVPPTATRTPAPTSTPTCPAGCVPS